MMTFDPVASCYDQLAHAVFGRRLERAQLAMLGQLPVGGRWLLVGGGTGWLLEQLMHTCRPDTVLYLDASRKMIDLAQKRLKKHPRYSAIIFQYGTEATLPPTARFDVILTPFVLDLFSEQWLLERMIPTLMHALEPTGCWLVTDFTPPTLWWQRLLVRSMILFFQLTAGLQTKQLPNWPVILQQRLRLIKKQLFLKGLIWSALFRPTSEIDR